MSDFDRIKNAWKNRAFPVVAKCVKCGQELTYSVEEEGRVFLKHVEECVGFKSDSDNSDTSSENANVTPVNGDVVPAVDSHTLQVEALAAGTPESVPVEPVATVKADSEPNSEPVATEPTNAPA